VIDQAIHQRLHVLAGPFDFLVNIVDLDFEVCAVRFFSFLICGRRNPRKKGKENQKQDHQSGKFVFHASHFRFFGKKLTFDIIHNEMLLNASGIFPRRV